VDATGSYLRKAMKYYSKYIIEDDVWGVGMQYLEYDVQTGEVLRQVNDYGNILLYSHLLANRHQAHGTCYHTEASLQMELQYDEDQVLERIFQAKWTLATNFVDPRLDVNNQAELTAEDVQALKAKFSALV
jgi:hypothetical protein